MKLDCPTCFTPFENAIDLFSHISKEHTKREIVRDFVYKYVSDEMMHQETGWKVIEKCAECGVKK